MLVLARLFGESVTIGDDIVVEVVEISRGKVKLGFTAPPEIPIHREEAKCRERKEAATWDVK